MTLFKQLYAGTLAVLILIAVLFSQGLNYYLRQDEINDFLDDVNQETQQLRTELVASGQFPPPLTKPLKPQTQNCESFCTSWLDLQGLETFTAANKLLQEQKHRSVYKLTTRNGLAVVYHYPAHNRYLLVTDTPAFSDHAETFHDDDEAALAGWLMLPWFYIGLGALGVAWVLYFLSHRIEKAIEQLQDVVTSYDANPTRRADETSPEPVRQLAASFNHMADRLEEQRREQQIMTHAIAHELRTPLARMRLALGMIEAAKTDAATQDLLVNLDGYITDMNHLTGDVLLLGRIGQAQDEQAAETTVVNMSEVLQQRLACLTPEQYSKVQAVIAPEVFITMATNHLQLLIDNLLNNALAYAQTQVNVTLQAEVKPDKTDQATIIFRVADDGPGINEAEKEQLFTPFYRGDKSRDRKTGGFGLGLAIVRSIARRYGMEITVMNRASGGAVFSLTGSRDEAVQNSLSVSNS